MIWIIVPSFGHREVCNLGAMSQNLRMSIHRTVTIQKIRGETPLEAIIKWKSNHTEFADIPTSYAGRLDPMAEGKLLVLLGDECKKQSHYTKLDKEYVIQVLLDFSTDTGDVLGFVEYSGIKTKILKQALQPVLEKEIGTHVRDYPLFSSKTVKGKPLFIYALEGSLDTIHIPEHSETIYSLKIEDICEENVSELSEHVKKLLAVVPRSNEPSKLLGADFRQDEVRMRWEKVFEKIAEDDAKRVFQIITLKVTCGSGAYMRTLASRIGKSLGTNALALSINRTKIGKFVRVGSMGVWLKNY
jgi:tRNA U55 pseudouridine synthase TruB